MGYRVAVVGATEKVGAVGRTVLWNLISSPFGGTVFPVNPTRPSVLGIKAYPSIADIPAKVDLVVVCSPSGLHVQLAETAIAAGKHVVIEKPLDVSVARARRISELAAEATQQAEGQ